MGNKNNFFSGITELLILAIINDHDSYAYEIVKHIKEYSDNYLSISQNTIYAVIYKLENEGKISHYSKLVGKRRTRVYYHIGEIGKMYYQEVLNNFRNAYNGVENILSALDATEEEKENE